LTNRILQKPALQRFLALASRRKYQPKTNIVYKGDANSNLYLVEKGQVVIVLEDEEEREVIVSYLGVGEFFGELGLFDKDKQHKAGAYAKARTVCEIASMSYDDFNEHFENDRELLDLIGQQIVQRLNSTTSKVHNLVFYDAKERVKNALLGLCQNSDAQTHPDGTQIKITRQEIGHIANCSREMVGRIIKNLEQEGFLTAKGKTMVIFNKEQQ